MSDGDENLQGCSEWWPWMDSAAIQTRDATDKSKSCIFFTLSRFRGEDE